jgi:hypothetical protein
MSAIMSDVKTKSASGKSTAPRTPARDTFTVRDLNRQPQVVLSAARKLGRVHIQGRSGERFLIQPEPSAQAEPSTREHFRARLRELHDLMGRKGSTGFTAGGWKTISEAIAGER